MSSISMQDEQRKPAVAVLGGGQGGTGPPNLAQAPQIFRVITVHTGWAKKLHTVFIAITLSAFSQFS